MSPQRTGKLNGDHTVTQLEMSWIREDWERNRNTEHERTMEQNTCFQGVGRQDKAVCEEFFRYIHAATPHKTSACVCVRGGNTDSEAERLQE